MAEVLIVDSDSKRGKLDTEVKIMRACAQCGATPAKYRPIETDERSDGSRRCLPCFDRAERELRTLRITHD